jgi:hypothetical protein
LKLDELERIKVMICGEQKEIVDSSMMKMSMNSVSPRAGRAALSDTSSSPMGRRRGLVDSGGNRKVEDLSAPVFDEIEQLLNASSSSSDIERTGQQSILIADPDDYNTSEMMLRNGIYCVGA